MTRTYLGDGAYADFGGFYVRIWCERDAGVHEVYLEPQHLQELIRFVRAEGWDLEDYGP